MVRIEYFHSVTNFPCVFALEQVNAKDIAIDLILHDLDTVYFYRW